MSCFCILRGKEDCAATEVYMLYLNPHEFTHPAAKLINDLEHQLMAVIVNAVEEILKFLKRQIADDLAKAFIPLGAFAFSARGFWVRRIISVHLHPNVKSAGLINVSVSAMAGPQNNRDGIRQRTKSMKSRKVYKLQKLNDY
jgi:hypothetical protein